MSAIFFPPAISVSALPLKRADALTDAEREAHIQSCGELMQAAMGRWEQHGGFSDRGEADFWRIQMEAAIKGRSAEQVARMESERGLA